MCGVESSKTLTQMSRVHKNQNYNYQYITTDEDDESSYERCQLCNPSRKQCTHGIVKDGYECCDVCTYGQEKIGVRDGLTEQLSKSLQYTVTLIIG